MKSQLLLLSALAAAPYASAVVSYTGTPYSQDFDSLANTGSDVVFTDDSTINGWTAYTGDTGYSGTGAFAFTLGTVTNVADAYDASNGSSNAGELYSFGTGTATDRALGSIGSGTSGEFFTVLQVTNATGLAATSFSLSYDGEQWRRGGTNTPQRAESLLFYYRVGGSAFDATGTWNSVSLLDFASPDISSTAAAAIDGNVNKLTLSQSVTAAIAAGESLWLVWVDPDNGGSDHGMAIDNVNLTLTTVPEPGSALLAAAGAGLALLRRRRA